MKNLFGLGFITVCFSISSAVVAETKTNQVAQIIVPAGYSLVETPPVFETVTKPVYVRANIIDIPPSYRTEMVNGRLVKTELVPAKKYEGIITQPFKTQSVRKLVKPAGYALKNDIGDIIKQWVWIDGELILAK